MKRFITIICVLVVLLSLSVLAEEIESGDYCYRILENGTAEITGYNGGPENLVIPSQLDGIAVTSIGNKAFYERIGLTSLTISEGVTTIGDDAFSCCQELTSVTLPDSITSIGANPFSYGRLLEDIMVSPKHEYLSVIDGVLFSKPDKRLVYCPPTKEGEYIIPKEITCIGDRAFTHCCYLGLLTIPDSVISMGTNPFSRSGIDIKVSPEHEYFAVIDGVLFSKPDRRLVFYPDFQDKGDYTIPQGIRIIGDEAFYFIPTLKSITIPSSVVSIGKKAFYRCDYLTSVKIHDGVVDIGDEAFYECFELTSITIPGSVKSIGDGAFYNCNYLTSVKISDGVVNIGDEAFYNCDLTSITIPGSVESIGDGAFADCSLSSVTISDGVVNIGDEAFYDCYNLTSITIPGSVESIGKDSFAECSDGLTIVVPRDSYALQYCKENGLNYEYSDALDWLKD